MDRPGDPAGHRPVGQAKGLAWLSQAEALCHQSGALKAWARVPLGLWVVPSERPGCKSQLRLFPDWPA